MTKLYKITEIRKRKLENYYLKMTLDELKHYLKTKRKCYGYIAGVGGDKSYDIFAVEA